jgi:hypothetical protein
MRGCSFAAQDNEVLQTVTQPQTNFRQAQTWRKPLAQTLPRAPRAPRHCQEVPYFDRGLNPGKKSRDHIDLSHPGSRIQSDHVDLSHPGSPRRLSVQTKKGTTEHVNCSELPSQVTIHKTDTDSRPVLYTPGAVSEYLASDDEVSEAPASFGTDLGSN